MADVEDYLQEGFDPRSVTIPRLRSILVTHNVDYPSSAKKPQLVELVTEHVLSQASKLRAQRARAKRSSLGIVNAGSAQDTSGWDDDELSPPRSVRRSKSPRKSSGRVKVEEEEDFSRARTASTRLSRSVSRQLSMEPEEVASARRARRTVTPQIKPEPEEVEEDEDEATVYDEEPSVFTDDNPFQSGSSPMAEPTPRASASRRRTAGSDVNLTAKSSRRRTAGTEYLRTSATPEPTRRGKTPEFLIEPGEEFTPEAQLELEDASAAGEVVATRKSSAPRRQGGIKTPFFVLLLALVGAYLAWYRQEKIAVGYCGLGRPAKQIIPDDIPVPDALLPFIEPLCEPCPKHAFCYEDFSVRCQDDFILQHHPLSLGGLVPIPPTCEPDSEKARRVKAVADKAVEELRERRAKFECGELTDDAGQPTDTPAIAEEELKVSVSRKRAKKMSNKEFDELWEAAIGDITDREEVEVTSQTTEVEDEETGATHFSTRYLSSTSLARISISCAVKRAIRSRLARYRLPIGLVGLVLLGIAYLRSRYRKHLATAAQVPALVDQVLGKLANQKELGDEDLDDSWLFLPNLRDDVLRAVHSLSERERIWRSVKAVVEQNSNVRTSQREGRSGEVGRAWEWIGPVNGEGARRRRSGRVSWGPDATVNTPEPVGNTAEMKKWEESRPIY